jgi:hypothetical protein
MMATFNTKMTPAQRRDTGMAMVLLALLLHLWLGHHTLLLAAIVLQVVTMTVPGVYRPVAVVWFGLSHVLGAIVAKLLMFVVFFLIVTPVGMIRRALGKDSLRLRHFKKDDKSVMWERNYTFTARDLERPY